MITIIGAIIDNPITLARVTTMAKRLDVFNIACATFGDWYHVVGFEGFRFAAAKADVAVMVAQVLPFFGGERATGIGLFGAVSLLLCPENIGIISGILLSFWFVLFGVFPIPLTLISLYLFVILGLVLGLTSVVLISALIIKLSSPCASIFPTLSRHKKHPPGAACLFDATQSDNAKGVRIDNSTLGFMRQLFRLSRTDIIAQMV